MKAALITNGPDFPNGEIFEFDGRYNSNVPYGVDRIAYHKLKREFESNGNVIKEINQYKDYSDIDVAIFIDIEYEYLWRLLECSDPPAITYVMREPPAVISANSHTNITQISLIFNNILTWNDSLSSNNDKFYKYCWPQCDEMKLKENNNFNDKKLLVNISTRRFSRHPSELYSERNRIIKFFNREASSLFTLYGNRWNESPRLEDLYNGSHNRTNKYEVYEGFVENKFDAYHNHRFALCFENQAGIDGWITEKIFDCFRAGIVPIYWGANNISEFIPSDAFVDYRDYPHPESLFDYLKNVDKEVYNSYLNAAQSYLRSDGFDQFSPDTYAKKVHTAAEEAAREGHISVPNDLLEKIRSKGRAQKLINNNHLSLTNTCLTVLKILRERPGTFVEQPGALMSIVD